MSISMSFPTGQEVASSSSSDFPQSCRHFTISEILVATKNFDESLVIGRGGYGKVYKGTIINGASVLDVAIKRLDSTSNQGATEFWAEVKMLSKLRHCHLVSLFGCCNDGQEMILVYEYMPHGTLEDHLHKRGTILPWLRRLKICVGAARGLDYLHTGTSIKHGVIHRDVKSSNILLDKSLAARVSDFGLSKICPINQSSTGISTFVKGTFGYLDPYYYSTGKLTRKSDVYAFGVVLLEVLCGKRAVDESIDEEQWGLAGWAQDSIKEGRLKQIVDSSLEGRASPKCLKEFARLADQCLHSNPKQRPTMAEVVVCLESILALQEKDKDRLQPMGMTIFGRKVPMFLSPNNGEHSSSVAKDLNSLDASLYRVASENRMLRRFDFATLNVATEGFLDANVILRSYMGDMYWGRLQNGQGIAILRIIRYTINIQEEIMNEASILVQLDRENVFLMLGYCIYGTEVFLVYKSIPYATLHHVLFNTTSLLLDWNKRYKILLGVAQGLLYLHKHAPIRVIHRDLTLKNILLDEYLNPKLSQFGIARRLAINETDCYVDKICGTLAYMGPECLLGYRLSCKADVFSFGMVVLETISGIESWTATQESDKFESLRQYAMSSWLEGTSFPIDPRIGVDSSLMTRFIEIGLWCVQEDEADRPTMEEVVDMLIGGSSLTLERKLSEIRERKLSEIRERKLSEIQERELLESSNDINASVDDYDVGAAMEFISDLCLR